MKPIRRSPVIRITVWLLTLALIMPTLLLGHGSAKAQNQQVLRVIVADFQNAGRIGGTNLAVSATAAVYNELVNSGQGRFYVFGNQEVLAEAKRIGLTVPSVVGQPANFSQSDLLRLARELQADAIVEGQVSTAQTVRGRPASAYLGITFRDTASQELINGGFAKATVAPRPGQAEDPEELVNRAVEDAALSAVREAVQRQLVQATVLQRVGDTVVLNRGLRDGIHEGDDLVVSRESGATGRVKQGIIRVARAYATDAEAEVRQDIGGVRPEDVARVLYTPKFIFNTDPRNPVTENRTGTRSVNFSVIGRTLAALGLGVLIATAIRGGESSVSNATAEASADNGQPTVRVSFGDTVFGQANVVQYKIYRMGSGGANDFPYSPSLSLITTSGGGGSGGGTGTTTTGAIPAGTTTTHSYTDRPYPYSPYNNGATILFGTSVVLANPVLGLNSSSGGGSGGSSGGTAGCTFLTFINPAGSTGTTTGNTPISTGFTVGLSETYQVTAVILRQQPTTGSSSGTGGGGSSGGSGGSSSGSTSLCIETDPVSTGLATPIQPILASSITSNSNALDGATIDLTAFRPSFLSRLGADVFQIEVSTDVNFASPDRIVKTTIMSTNSSGESLQTAPSFPNLFTAPELLLDPTFAAYAGATGGTSPTLYIRIGARHDEDSPGPVNWFDKNNARSGDRTYRFVYSTPIAFTGAVRPPGNPGNSRAVVGAAARSLNAARSSRAVGLPLPLPGDTTRGRGAAKTSVLSIQSILAGHGRTRP